MSTTFSFQLTQGVRRAARLTPDRPATLCEDRARTWAEFEERVARLAKGFRALGVSTGERIAMLSHNSDYYVEFFFATLWAGAVAVPLNTRWAHAELQSCIDDARPKLLIADPTHEAAARRLVLACPSLDGLILAGGVRAGGALSIDELIDGSSAAPDACRHGEDLACLFYTGGTTGRSKGVMLTHGNLMANSLVAVAGMRMSQHTRHLHVSPLFHVAGGSRLFSVSLAGGTHVVVPKFEPGAFLRTIAAAQVTLTIIVPTMLNQLIQALEDQPELKRLDLSSLTLLTYGASPMPEALLLRARDALPGVAFMQGYGMTECAPLISNLSPEDHQFEGPRSRYLKSAGRPVPTAEVAILDADGNELPHGEVGEVCVRGPMVMKGYWNLPDLTEEALRGGWLHTGDAGYLDQEGFLFLVDRVKDMIVSGGENVYSAEVETALHGHPEVLECAVIGVPDENWGEAVHAVVVARPGSGLTPTALDEICRGLIAGFKCPKGYTITEESLPKSGAGKILKTPLKAAFWKDRERRIN